MIKNESECWKYTTRKLLRTGRWISVSIILALAPFMISGSAATTAVVNSQTTQAFSKCTDPTGQNLQCILTTSKLPLPAHTLLCQESSGQIFKCNYVIETLRNGLHVVVMTVYVPSYKWHRELSGDQFKGDYPYDIWMSSRLSYYRYCWHTSMCA